MDSMKNTLSNLANSYTTQERGRFLSQPQQNPKRMHEVVVNEENSAHIGEIKAIMTPRNGKQVNQSAPSLLHEEEDFEISEKAEKWAAVEQNKEEKASKEVEKKFEKIIIKEGSMTHLTPHLFPNSLKR